MADFEAPVCRIRIESHPNADRLELAVIGDYRCVVGKGDFVDGDLAVYIPEATIVPDDILEEIGLVGRLSGSAKNRVRAAKLRGVVSQGIIYPISGQRLVYLTMTEGEDAKDLLGLTKYEPVIPAQLMGRHLPAMHITPGTYEIENIKKFPDEFREGEPVVVTEKLHGTWCCYGYHRDFGPFATSKGLSARGIVIDINDEKNKETNEYVKKFWEMKETWLRLSSAFVSVAQEEDSTLDVQACYVVGELYGSGIQDLNYNVAPSFRAFDIGVRAVGSHSMMWLEYDSIRNYAVEVPGLEIVPELYRGGYDKDLILGLTNGPTVLCADHMREGIVIRPLPERLTSHGRRLILKSVSDEYLLRKGGTDHN